MPVLPVFVYMNLCAYTLCMCLVPKETRRGNFISWSWSYRWLYDATWVLGIELWSSGREARALLNCSASSLIPFRDIFSDRISEPGVQWFDHPGQQAQGSTCSYLNSPGITAMFSSLVPGFLCGSWEWNSGLYSCMTSTYLSEPPPWPVCFSEKSHWCPDVLLNKRKLIALIFLEFPRKPMSTLTKKEKNLTCSFNVRMPTLYAVQNIEINCCSRKQIF